MASVCKLSKNPHPNPLPEYREREKAGFTLIELLVVIGIIAVLAAFAVPAIYKSWKAGVATKTKADFQVIATGLEAFKADTGDYPRVDAPNTGFAVLARALVAPGETAKYDTGGTITNPPPTWSASKEYKPGDVVVVGSAPTKGTPNSTIYICAKTNTGQSPSATSQYWQLFWPYDYLDGPGTKAREGGPRAGPYVQPDRFRMRTFALLDGDENAILYFPASPARPNINVATGEPFVSRGAKTSVFDANDNYVFFMSGADTYPAAAGANCYKVIRAMLGDFNPQNDSDSTNCDGSINSNKGESALTTGPYILWSPGNDGVYGPTNKGATPFPTKNDLAKCDDVTNFK